MGKKASYMYGFPILSPELNAYCSSKCKVVSFFYRFKS